MAFAPLVRTRKAGGRRAGALRVLRAALVPIAVAASAAPAPGSGAAHGAALTTSAGGELPARGKFLIASRELVEPTFARRVVLLLDYHDSRGGLGLIINRPSPFPLARIVPELEGVEVRAPFVRSGGPVERNRLFMLLRAASRPPGTERILEDTYGASTLGPLRALIGSGEASSAHFVVYAGYAGWAPGQLEGEIERGDWHVAPGRSEYVFDFDASEVWPHLIRYHGGQWVEGPILGWGLVDATASTPAPRGPVSFVLEGYGR